MHEKMNSQKFMTESTDNLLTNNFGSNELDKLVSKLQACPDPRKRYEYLLFMAKNLPCLPEESLNPSIKVQGCISQVYVIGELENGKLFWKGYSDALITKGLLSFLIKGLNNLTPQEILEINPSFITATGLGNSLTPSRVNGFMNIFLMMKNQACSFL